MKIKLVFDDWQKDGKSVYNTEEAYELSLGNFHSGTTFKATIDLDKWEEKEIKEAIKSGYTPTFLVVEDNDDKENKD